MSVTTHDTDSHSAHHEPIEVVDGRQRLGVWLFIGGDVVTLGALLFTYLYLRGTNTLGHWRSIVAYDFSGLTPAQANNLMNTTDQTLHYEHTISQGLNWTIVIAVLLSASVMWLGEDRLRSTGATVKKFLPFAYGAVLFAIVGTVLAWEQLLRVPQYYQVANDSEVFVHTAYGSSMIALGGALIIHLIILALLGVGLIVRAQRGVISPTAWHQVRLVRLFWVWVALSTFLTALVTTFAT